MLLLASSEHAATDLNTTVSGVCDVSLTLCPLEKPVRRSVYLQQSSAIVSATYLALGVLNLLYQFIPFIALHQIYSLLVFNFNFLVHKKFYFVIFYCISLYISTYYTAYYCHISAFLTAYFGSFYCIKIRSLVISYNLILYFYKEVILKFYFFFNFKLN